MKERILRELPEEKFFHFILGDIEKFLSLGRNVIREPSTLATEVEFKNSIPFMPREYFSHLLHSFLSIQGLRLCFHGRYCGKRLYRPDSDVKKCQVRSVFELNVR